MKALRRNFHFKNIDSTSAYLLRRRFVLRNFSTVYADYQTAGKGRENRVWESQENNNLLFSILVTDNNLCSKYKYISLAAALAVSKTLRKFGINSKIKWPNDVYVYDKKVCGILLQSVSNENGIEALVIGVGINVNQTKFSNTFMREPTSISLLLNRKVKVKKIKKLFSKILKKELNKLKKGQFGLIDYVKKNDYLKGKRALCEIKGEKKSVDIIGINSDCTLRVKCDDKILDLLSGEITFHTN